VYVKYIIICTSRVCPKNFRFIMLYIVVYLK